MRVRRKSQKARAMRGLGRMSRGVDSAWNRKGSRLRWRRGEADCMPRLWKGKAGSRRGLRMSNLSIEDGRMGRWVREWKENGRMYSLSRDYNRGGCFLRLGVADLERKRFSVFIPKGRGVKGGWASMVDILRSLGCEETTKVAKEKERAAVRVDVTKEEVGRNLSKLGHCIVGTWNHNAAKGDDLRGWGSQLARIWRGKVLMEFEIPAEAEQASKMGSILLGGVALRLEKWSPETGCLKEGERSNEAWVRVVGLPVSLWERDILRKIGEACGGLLAIDHQTEKMEELQWARLLRGKVVVTIAKEGGDVSARAGVRVLGAIEDSRLEDCLLTVDGTQRQSSGPLRGPDVDISNCWGRMISGGYDVEMRHSGRGSPGPTVPCWRKTQGVFRPFWAFCGVNQGGLSMQGNWAFRRFVGKCWDLKGSCLARPISQEEGA
ncbi:hypothetical protein AAG906_003170 [Vitis piasezkii]